VCISQQNAVNMVKVLLKTSAAEIDKIETDVDLVQDETSPFLSELLQNIMNTQNGQIMSVCKYAPILMLLICHTCT